MANCKEVTPLVTDEVTKDEFIVHDDEDQRIVGAISGKKRKPSARETDMLRFEYE